MLRIRLSRVGKKKRPVYRIVVTDSRSPRDGPSVEIIGHYDPLPHPAEIVVKEERAIHWLQVGAQPSEAAAKLLTRLGIMEKAGRQPFLRAPVQAAKTDAKVKVKAKAKAKAKAEAEPEAKAEPKAEEVKAGAEVAVEETAAKAAAPEEEAAAEAAEEAETETEAEPKPEPEPTE